MKVKVGDQVHLIAGTATGTERKIIKTLRKEDRVVVEGINIVKKHLKPRYTNETGSIQETEAPIHVSNVKKVEEKVKSAKTSKKKAS